MVRPLGFIVFALVALACDEAATPQPRLELYIDGTLQTTTPTIAFPPTAAGSDGIAIQITIKNLGPGKLELTGSPLILIERDDRLAFRVTQPPTAHYASGESLSFGLIFAPHAAGTSAAKVTVATNALDPIVLTLSGEGVGTNTPAALVATIDGAPIDEVFDFGTVRTSDRREVQLRLANVGASPLVLGPSPVSIAGPDAALFDLGTTGVSEVAPQGHVDIALGFEPTGCRSYGATLTISPPDLTPIEVELSGRGGENPQGHADVIIDADKLETPNFAVALSANGPGGKRRFAVGNMAAGTFSGRVMTYSWDGCALGAARTITPTAFGLSANLFGAQVGLSDDGTTLLVTAYDNTKDAWLFGIGVDDEPRYLGTLTTFDQGGGHGRGAAIAGNGTAVFVGQVSADSGFNAHGAVFVYERQGGGWESMPEAKQRLGPSAPTQAELIGSSVVASESGDVVVSGALSTPAGAPSKGPATAFVWVAAPDPDGGRLWGKAIPQGEANQRIETVRLTSAQVPTDSMARVAISADGNTIVMSAVVNTEVQIRVYARTGIELWGRPTSSLEERIPTAVMKLTASPALRLAVGPAGNFIVIADLAGAREIARPGMGWADEAPLTEFAQRWNVPFYGALAVTRDANAFVGLDRQGSAWFVFR